MLLTETIHLAGFDGLTVRGTALHCLAMPSREENEILTYLRSSPLAAFSGREICRRAGGKQAWLQNPRWALPLLSRLISRGLVETDSAGHYRLTRPGAR